MPSALISSIKLFPFPPNWDNPVIESLEWRTDILRSYDGEEQRRSLRVLPRRGLEYDFTVKSDNARLFESLLWSWQSRLFGVPLWMFRSALTAPCSNGDTVIALDTTDLGFANGGVACIYRSPTEYELVDVNVVSSNQITLSYPLSQSWQQGEKVYPVLVGKPPSSLPTQRKTDRLLTGRASFMSSADQNDPFLPATVAPVIYDGKEVVTARPNWRDDIDNTWMHEFDSLDSGIGAVRWSQTEVSGRVQRPYGYFLKSKADIAAFRAFLGRVRGQAKAFWVPSWHDDFTVIATTASGASTLTVDGNEFMTYVGVDVNRDRLAIRLIDGTMLYRKITGTTALAGDTVFQLDAPFAQNIGPDNVARVYLLLHCRMASDKVEIPWRTTAFADPQLMFTTVPV